MSHSTPTMHQPAGSDAPAAGARRIIQLNLAYTQARVLQAAVELGLFAALDGAPATPAEICQRLTLHPRLTGDWLAALAELGLLERCGDTYTNSPLAQGFLVPGRPCYLGGSVAAHGRVHYALWGDLTAALRDGQAKSGPATQAAAVDGAAPDHERARGFLAHMDAFSTVVAAELSRVLDWTRWTSFVDVGGARGNIAARLVRSHPHLSGTVFDVPAVGPLFDEHMRALGTTGQVGFAGGDFFTGPLPTADVAIVGHVLHDWPPESRAAIIGQVYRALPPGGTLLVYDAMLDEAADAHSYLQSMVCGLIRDGGSEYTVAAARQWVEDAGFRYEGVTPLDTITRDRLLRATKPA